MNIGILIPANNEGVSLGDILKELRNKSVKVLVVDDGSRDNTYDIAKAYADMVLKNEINSGKGRALQMGIEYFLEEKDIDYIITMDGDGQHLVSDIDRFLQAAKNGALFVVGNRMHDPQGMPKLRILTNKLMSFFISKIVGQDIPDTQCGFRLIKKEVLENIKLKTSKFEIETELIIKAAKNNINIQSVPIKSVYSKNQRSRINPLVDTWRFFKFIFSLFRNKK